jgi:inorganic pyrophosphatase
VFVTNRLNTYDEQFWQELDGIVAQSTVIIDCPRGSKHPRFPNIVYAVDYGYLEGTSSMDGGGIDVWRGTAERQAVDAIICTLDLMKKDSEIKLLIGCTQAELETVYDFHNESEFMKGLFISRK